MAKNTKKLDDILKITHCIFFSIFSIFLFSTPLKAGTLADFLRSNAVRVDQGFIRQYISFFLNHRYHKGEIFWFEGAIIAKNEERYDHLRLKFNTIDNSLYLHIEDQFYRIISSGLKEFILYDKGSKRRFVKGFGEIHIHLISASYYTNAIEVIKYLAEYPQADDFRILELSTIENEPNNGSLIIRIRSGGIKPVYALQRYLGQQPGMGGVQIESGVPQFDENTFFEVLVDGKEAQLLKLNYKQSSQSESISLVKQSDFFTFNKFTYYLSDRDENIRRLQFSRKSVRKALSFANVDFTGDIPSVRKEKQLVSWLGKIL